MNGFPALQGAFSANFRNHGVHFSADFMERKHLCVWTAAGSAKSSNSGDFSVLFAAGVCHHSWRSCHPCSPSRSAPHSGQSWDEQGSAGPVPTNPAASGGNSLRMMYRICPQLLPEGGAVAGEKLFPSQTWKRISVHSTRLMMDALHNINCNSNH